MIPFRMKPNRFLLFLVALFFFTLNLSSQPKEPTIFATGGSMDTTFIKYIASLTGKEYPKICYVPTANADNPYGIIRWYERCRDLPVKPYVLKVWISSYTDKQSFADILLNMDAIIVGGGNTLNMIAIWKAQGIDTVLAKAYKRGIILAGGSAGSLCWFAEGTTDSRPGELTTIKGLGFLKYSHSPHYNSEGLRRPMYRELIEKGIYLPGYAIDNRAAILFKNGKFARAVTLDKKQHAYFVTVKNGKVVEKELSAEIIGE